MVTAIVVEGKQGGDVKKKKKGEMKEVTAFLLFKKNQTKTAPKPPSV
jgi:hypothetical protein